MQEVIIKCSIVYGDVENTIENLHVNQGENGEPISCDTKIVFFIFYQTNSICKFSTFLKVKINMCTVFYNKL